MSIPNPTETIAYVERYFEDDALGVLSEYIAIPCLSPDFDADWAANGAIDRAAGLFADWARKRPLADASVEVVAIAGRTPCVLIEVGATAGATAAAPTLFYGHLDKQPPLGTWSPGLDAFTPVRRGDRLYGRGSADDGYAIFAALGAVETAEATGAPHGPVTVLIEASEESASTDLDAYLDALAGRVGQPGLVLCLDSGGASYDRLWTTSSLRGLVDGVLRVEVLTDAVHSGLGGGVVPSSFRILRQLLDRIDDPATGDVRLGEAWVEIPADRAVELDGASGFDWSADLPVVPGLQLEGADARNRAERGTWRAALEILGAEGLPPIAEAGNLLRPSTTIKVSLRIPPTADASVVAAALSRVLTDAPPSGARVTFTPGHAAAGWNAPALSPWLAEALNDASTSYFGNPAAAAGVGGSIPFMASLGTRYPTAQFLATGALGPGANAHGIDESLHVPAAKALIASAAHLLSAVAERAS